MNDPLLAAASTSPLSELLDRQFGTQKLREVLGGRTEVRDLELWRRALYAPLSEFLSRSGKEFRANLVVTSFRLCGGRGDCPDLLPLIVEILHAGSLVIDDIEDESTHRRGAPTMHEQHGLPVALNAGNWLYFWALDLVEEVGLPDRAKLELYRQVNRTMVRSHHGQGLDITSHIRQLRQSQVQPVVLATSELKTGALMELAAVLGAVAAEASPVRLAAMANFGRGLGVALQMLDDVGGLVSDGRADKGHEDLRLGRPTWPWAWLSQDLSEVRYRELVCRAQRAENSPRALTALLTTMREQLHGSGRVRVRRHIHQLFAQLRQRVGNVDELFALRAQINQMEKSYG